MIIVNLQFVDRDEELALLEGLHRRGKASLVILYGRRRVGKTRLIQEFQKKRGGLYLYTPNGEEKTILDEYSAAVEPRFFPGFRFTDLSSFLNYLQELCRDETIVSIDEFQRLSNIDGAISLIQKHWDESLSKGKCTLILSGSSMGAIQRLALSGDAPLQGRRTAAIKVNPLRYVDLGKWFQHYSPEDLVKIFGAFGGTPAYLEHIDEKKTPEQNIIDNILRRNSPLYSEPETLLMEEVRTPQRYMDILTAIAQGHNKFSEISNDTGIGRETTVSYLTNLEILDLIVRVTPVTDPEAKRGLYEVKDPFFRFWFGLVRPNQRQLELGLENNVWKSIEGDYNGHLGHIFEAVCMETVVEMGRRGLLPIRLDGVGRWWMGESEIDILGIEKPGKALAIEVKWSTLSTQDARRLTAELSAKVQQVKEASKVTLGLMAKKIENKKALRDEGFLALDLDDIMQPSNTQTS